MPTSRALLLPPLESCCLALLIGLSRALLPFFFLQSPSQQRQHEQQLHVPSWLPSLAHLVHHCSAILGTAVGPKLLAKSQFLVPADASSADHQLMSRLLLFLAATLKTCSLALVAFASSTAAAAAADVAEETRSLLCWPSLLLLASILGIGLSDGILQRLLLLNALALNQKQPRKATGNGPLLTLLLQLSAGPLLTALLLLGPMASANVNGGDETFLLLRLLSVQFSVQPKFVFGALAIFQAILLFPLWPKNSEQFDEEEAPTTVENSPISLLAQPLEESSKHPPKPIYWSLLLPFIVLAFLCAALSETFSYALFAFVEKGNAMEMESGSDFLLFSVSFLASRLLLALLPLTNQGGHASASKLASPNKLFPLGLFGTGLSLCTLNAPLLRQLAVSLLGLSLSLIWPVILLHWRQHEKVQRPTSLLWLIAASQCGPLLFPVFLTQISSAYGGPQLFSSVGLLAVLLMVIAFVCLLNAQSEVRNAAANNDDQLWSWFRGEASGEVRGSIHRFVRNVRGSLRRQKKKATANRCQKRRRAGTGDALLEESSVGRHSRSNYHSFQCLDESSRRFTGESYMSIAGARTRSPTAASGRSRSRSPLVPLGLRRGQCSLPSIVIHQGTPSSQSAKSLQSLTNKQQPSN